MATVVATPGISARRERRPRPAGPRSSRDGRVGLEWVGDVPNLGEPMSESPYGEPTLDDVIAGAWEELAVRGLARCPVCGGEMHAEIESTPTFDADGAPPTDEDELDLTATLSGTCVDCGTRFE